MPNANSWEVVVIGAGAAGLLAAARAAERGKRTLLLEKNRKPGVKILISGGTRCNLTHACDRAGILAAFGSAGPFLHSALAALGPGELVELFTNEGVATYVEEGTGKIFPQSNRAVDVVAALVGRLERSGAALALGEAVRAIEQRESAFEVITEHRSLHAEKIILATGGLSYPGCGTTGDGYAWAQRLGHTLRPTRPALVPLLCDAQWLRELAGLSLPDVQVEVIDPAAPPRTATQRRRNPLPQGVLQRRRGAVLFTHFGLSGPVILDVSRAMTGAADPRQLRLVIDLLPDCSREALEQSLVAQAAADGKRLAVSYVPAPIQRRLTEAIFAQGDISLDRRGCELTKAERTAIVQHTKQLTLVVSGSRGYAKAEVTAGGVPLEEVDSRTMESKRMKGLFLAGEILDLDGYIGGFNFQAAFSTGWLAASSV